MTTRRSQNIKKSIISYYKDRKISYNKFKINSYYVKFQINYDNYDNNVPLCTCINYNADIFCEHVFYVLLFKYKVNIKNKILKKNFFTETELNNIFSKQYRNPSQSRIPRIRQQRRISPRPSARRRLQPQPSSPSGQNMIRQLSQSINRNSVSRRRRYMESLLRNLRQRELNISRRLRRSSIRVNLHIPQVPPSENIQEPSPIYRRSDTRNISNFEIVNLLQSNTENKCSICLNEFCVTNQIITRCSICSNNFHYICLDTWIVEKMRNADIPSCPLCRSRINIRD